MDAEQVEILVRGEEILARAHEVSQFIEEETRKLIRSCSLTARRGWDWTAKEAVERGPVRPAEYPPSQWAART